MAKVYIVCGKICSGKTHYIEILKNKMKAVVLSPDEVTYDLIKNEQGEFYNIFSKRVISYLNKKAIEIVKADANVIYERGLWTKNDRDLIKKYFEDNNIPYELHYIHVNDIVWKEYIKKRNKEISELKNEKDFYLDEGLLNKLNSKFEEPNKDEIDIWYENNQ